MKKKRKEKRYLAAVLALAGLLSVGAAGCGGGAGTKNAAGGITMESAADTAAVEAPAEACEEDVYNDAGAVASEEGIEPVAQNGRKLIKTVRLEMQTKEFDVLMEGLRKKIQEMDGYIENSAVWGNSYNYTSTRSSEYTVRVPANRLDEFIEVVGGLGNVTYKSESVEDVTLQYVDVESRQKALETEQTRLLELLEKADNLEDLLTIESRLSEVRYELENFGSQKRLLDNQIEYSTVHLSVTEVERITEVGKKTFFQEIAERFSNSLYNVGMGLREFVIVVVGSLPVLAVWAAVIALVVLVLRRVFYNKNTKNTERKGRWGKKTPEDAGRTPDEKNGGNS